MHFQHLFNPQNDLALANGTPTFTAPKSALSLSAAGACLPLWYGDAGDVFIGAVNKDWFVEICDAFQIDVRPAMNPLPGFIPCPWGWSPQALRYLRDLGFSEAVLPSPSQVDGWRLLSSRVTGIRIIRDFILHFPVLAGSDPDSHLPVVTDSLEEALVYIASNSPAIIKLPWSGSGRGQQISDRTTPQELEKRLNGMIAHQGAVEISPFYDKLLDFALLWHNNGFAGCSLFETDSHGSWTGNILLPDNEIMSLIADKFGRDIDFSEIISFLSDSIAEFSREYDYSGPVGVDFIVGRDRFGRMVMLPVEINWRRTMGHVSHSLFARFVSPGSRGSFKIIPASQSDKPFHLPSQAQISEGRLRDGYIDLVPWPSSFRFILSAVSSRLGC